jgi:hypothetical protein
MQRISRPQFFPVVSMQRRLQSGRRLCISDGHLMLHTLQTCSRTMYLCSVAIAAKALRLRHLPEQEVLIYGLAAEIPSRSYYGDMECPSCARGTSLLTKSVVCFVSARSVSTTTYTFSGKNRGLDGTQIFNSAHCIFGRLLMGLDMT